MNRIRQTIWLQSTSITKIGALGHFKAPQLLIQGPNMSKFGRLTSPQIPDQVSAYARVTDGRIDGRTFFAIAIAD